MENLKISKSQNTIRYNGMTLRFVHKPTGPTCYHCKLYVRISAEISDICQSIPCAPGDRGDRRSGYFRETLLSQVANTLKLGERFNNLLNDVNSQFKNTSDMDIKNLKPEERKALMEQLQEEEAAEKQKKENDAIAYKASVSENVRTAFSVLEESSKNLVKVKSFIRDMFAASIALKGELYGVKIDQRSHTFTDESGKYRITLGVNVNDAYDDTVETGIQIVKEYIASLAQDENSKLLVAGILRLLSRDQKGMLKASRVLQLQQLAEQSRNDRFLEGVAIIKNAYKPVESKSYIKAEYKNDEGAWVSLPLGITEA